MRAVMYGFLLVGGLALAKVPTKLPPDAQLAEKLYRSNCTHCHGVRGAGGGPLASSLPTVVPVLAGLDAARVDALTELVQDGKGDMPAFSPVLDRRNTQRILSWLAGQSADDPGPEDAPTGGPPEAEPSPDAPDAVPTGDAPALPGADLPTKPPKDPPEGNP